MPLPTTLSTDPHDWQFERRLGSGGGAQAWLVSAGGALCTLKLAHPNTATELASEAERLAFSVSPHLPKPRRAGRLAAALRLPDGEHVAAGSAYLLLSYTAGHPLDQSSGAGIAPVEQAWIVARDIGQALADLHAAGVAHNDVKPQNIVFCDQSSSAKLIDLGLAEASAQTQVRGGTWRYLSVDRAENSPAQARDLAALGLTLLELLNPEARADAEPAAHLERHLLQLDAHWRPVLTALLGPARARPGAAWLVRQASRWTPPLAQDKARRFQIQRAYLATRAAGLRRVSRGRAAKLSVGGPPQSWLEDCCAVMTGIAELRGARSDAAELFESLSEHDRRKWLLKLIGVASVDFPALPAQSDEQLAERLLALSEARALEGLGVGDLHTNLSGAAAELPSDPRDVALLLGSASPSEAVLETAELLVASGTASRAMVFALSDALRRRHELGRSLFVLSHAGPPQENVSVALRTALVLLRAADFAAAEKVLQPWSSAPAASAVLSRLRLAQGNLEGAASILEHAPMDVETLQAHASVQLSRGELLAAETSLQTSLALPHNAEQRARGEALLANLAQQRGDAEQAFSRFRSAAEHAARAGALVEEATYLSGVASTATNLGRVGQTLAAARRASLLFEHLGRPEAAARASLARAGAFTLIGASTEAQEAARETIEYARAAGDSRCRAFAHLVLCDVNETGAEDELQRAENLLRKWSATPRSDDQLRLAARRLKLGHDVDAAQYDVLAAKEQSADVRLEWWGHRAQTLLSAFPRPSAEQVQPVLAQLAALLTHKASVEARGFAFSFGAHLAAEHADGDRARQLSQAANLALRALRAGVPAEFAPQIEQLPWAKLIRSPRETQVSAEQLSDIETLIIGLGERGQLKPLLNRVLDALVLWTGVERGLLLLRAPGGQLVPRAARNLARSDLDGEQLRLSTTLAERALNSGECVVAIDAAGELPELHKSVHSLRLRSVLAVPLLARGDVLGVAYLDDRMRRGAFGPRELSWVRLVATLAAVAIADTRDQLLLRRAVRQARRAEDRLSRSLAQREAQLELAEKELAYAKNSRGTRFQYNEIIGNSEPIRQMLRLVDRVSQAQVPVLISGESGSGKELVARALHNHSPRKAGPFVSENCSAIPESLLESTLFGHVKGAFTGASHSRAGLFEIAHQGCLFLDEIGDMSLAMQSKLLRVLETGEVRRVGAERVVRVDVRIVAASHKRLEDLVASGQFREDLFYRLNVVAVHVPALRERASDIPLLVRYFIQKHAASEAPANTDVKPSARGTELARFSDAALQAMVAYDWPGNVRQLENETRRALVLSDGQVEPQDLSPALRGLAGPAAGGTLNLRQRVDALETELVRNALQETAGNQTKAAALLGVSRFGLQKMVKRLGIHYDAPSGQSKRVSVTEN